MLTLRTGFVLALGLATLGFGLGVAVERDSASAAAPAISAPQTGVVAGPARVIDGDTVDIGGTRIRIQGIDAPEHDDRCRDAAGRAWACGQWSTEVARAAFEGADLRCRDLGERTWGRVVAQCFLGEEDFAAIMLRKGAARACPRFANQHAHSRGYMALERQAKAAGAGIFAGTPPPLAGFCEERRASAPDRTPERPAELVQASGGDCRIKGNINASGERIYHVPGQRFYDVTRIDTSRGQRWFCSEAEAQAAGWRRALR